MSTELPKIEKVPGVLHQDPAERERESAELAAVEEAKRTRFFADCVEGNADLTPEHRMLIAKAMGVRKTAAWAAYDGEDVKFVGMVIEGNVMVLKFDFYDGMNVAREKISLE
jgi:hypothetical protein